MLRGAGPSSRAHPSMSPRGVRSPPDARRTSNTNAHRASGELVASKHGEKETTFETEDPCLRHVGNLCGRRDVRHRVSAVSRAGTRQYGALVLTNVRDQALAWSLTVGIVIVCLACFAVALVIDAVCRVRRLDA
jgi:hypothetical protein